MENCCYHGKILCTYELKDASGYYYEDKVIEWKEAAAERRLTCVECGAPVYLAAGPVKEPYFAHYDIEACNYGGSTESEELKKGKRLLYHLLGRSFPGSDVQAHYRLANGMYATLFCTDGEHRIAVDYRLQNTSLEKYRERDNYYQEKGITVIYILGKRLDKKTKQPDWYQTLIQKSMGYLAFLDTEKETLNFKKSISYRLGKERRFQSIDKTYPVRETEIDWNGMPKGSFDIECIMLAQAIKEEKVSYHKKQDQLKRLQNERTLLEETEQKRMEAYRNRMKQLEMEAYRNKPSSEKIDLPSSDQCKHPTEEELIAMGINPNLYQKCLTMVREGNSQLVAAKYLEVINRFVQSSPTDE
jgi:competence CoiA-like predicted nuclease